MNEVISLVVGFCFVVGIGLIVQHLLSRHRGGPPQEQDAGQGGSSNAGEDESPDGSGRRRNVDDEKTTEAAPANKNKKSKPGSRNKHDDPALSSSESDGEDVLTGSYQAHLQGSLTDKNKPVLRPASSHQFRKQNEAAVRQGMLQDHNAKAAGVKLTDHGSIAFSATSLQMGSASTSSSIGTKSFEPRASSGLAQLDTFGKSTQDLLKRGAGGVVNR
ncbi:unnamed protein product [Amoebophrya sp. A120]|nr:unnamed protein product [Amoebophrya sp. A120]|eukprot:GSA120T00009961001.1